MHMCLRSHGMEFTGAITYGTRGSSRGTHAHAQDAEKSIILADELTYRQKQLSALEQRAHDDTRSDTMATIPSRTYRLMLCVV